MLNLNKILVARDFSQASDTAFRFALELANRCSAEVHTLFAEVIHGPIAPPGDEQEHGGKLANLVVKNTIVRDVAAAPAILHYARDNDVDLIVLGTHGRRGLRRLFLGSMAEEVVRLSTRPVLTVHASSTVRPDLFKEILVPIDFSPHSRAALTKAVSLARDFGATLDLLHIIEEPLHPAFYNTGVFSIYDLQPDIELRAEQHLRQLYDEVGAEDIEARFHVKPGHAAREIVAFANDRRTDLIVTSTHGLTGLEHLLIGSVAEKVTRMAPCPVLTVKPVDFDVVRPTDMHSEASQ